MKNICLSSAFIKIRERRAIILIRLRTIYSHFLAFIVIIVVLLPLSSSLSVFGLEKSITCVHQLNVILL